ncbi:MAG: hypothetical protein H7239_08225 [Flavobacterium sp.]|nr:hypothetical protein [Flavobacterium sp.]
MKTFLNIIIFIFFYGLQAIIFNTSMLGNASILIVTLILVNKYLNEEAEKKENEKNFLLEEKYNQHLEKLQSYRNGEMDFYEKQKFEEEFLDDDEIEYYKEENQNIKK